jgi:hypothetical protein
VGGGDDEAVAGAGLEPFLQAVGDVLAAAGHLVVRAAAAGDVQEVAHGGVAAGGADHAIAHRLHAGHALDLLRREGLVHGFDLEVEVQRLG